MARLRATRDPLRQDASANSKGHGRHSKAAADIFMKPSLPSRAVGRCVILTPKNSPATCSRSCNLTSDEPSSVESGAVPSNSNSWATKRMVEFAITDGGSDASGSKGSKGGDEPSCGYEKMQTRIRKKERSQNNVILLQAINLAKPRISRK